MIQGIRCKRITLGGRENTDFSIGFNGEEKGGRI
jgi:hypothetical protein